MNNLRSIKDYLAVNLNLPFLYSNRSYSQEGEDMILKKLFSNVGEGFYVDVGAHHPLRYSNTYLLYKKGWRGINIEPDVNAFKSFKKLRSKDINLNIGASSVKGKRDLYVFEDSAFNTFSKKRAELVKEDQSRLIKRKKVKVDTLENIFDIYLTKRQSIDLLNIDVEGLEEEVLRSNNWKKYSPGIILIENVGKNNISSMLSKLDYKIIAKTPMSDFYQRK